MSIITIERKVLARTDELAETNRALLHGKGIFSVNLVSSPGSGKTSILERTLESVRGRVAAAVIEGDVQTDLDAQRVARHHVPTVQIVTRGGCHLDAFLVQDALQKLSLDGIRLLIIENVGNLVCPANYDLGEDVKVVVVSTTEGDDKPLKYPEMFLRAGVMIINKMDLLPYAGIDLARLEKNAMSVNPRLRVFRTSCRTGEGLNSWCDWLTKEAAK